MEVLSRWNTPLVGVLVGRLDIYLTKHFLINGEGTVILTTNDITSPTSRQSLTGLYYVSTEAGFQYRF